VVAVVDLVVVVVVAPVVLLGHSLFQYQYQYLALLFRLLLDLVVPASGHNRDLEQMGEIHILGLDQNHITLLQKVVVLAKLIVIVRYLVDQEVEVIITLPAVQRLNHHKIQENLG
jgi:hypothetical protein